MKYTRVLFWLYVVVPIITLIICVWIGLNGW